jgi:hypothetical protein
VPHSGLAPVLGTSRATAPAAGVTSVIRAGDRPAYSAVRSTLEAGMPANAGAGLKISAATCWSATVMQERTGSARRGKQ